MGASLFYSFRVDFPPPSFWVPDVTAFGLSAVYFALVLVCVFRCNTFPAALPDRLTSAGVSLPGWDRSCMFLCLLFWVDKNLLCGGLCVLTRLRADNSFLGEGCCWSWVSDREQVYNVIPLLWRLAGSLCFIYYSENWICGSDLETFWHLCCVKSCRKTVLSVTVTWAYWVGNISGDRVHAFIC